MVFCSALNNSDFSTLRNWDTNLGQLVENGTHLRGCQMSAEIELALGNSKWRFRTLRAFAHDVKLKLKTCATDDTHTSFDQVT